jgi:hypothetical protein
MRESLSPEEGIQESVTVSQELLKKKVLKNYGEETWLILLDISQHKL